jgi:hypothetical protein
VPNAKQIASLVGMTNEREVTSLLDELEAAGVFSRADTGAIFSRRLVRDYAARQHGKSTGSLGGNPALSPRKVVNGGGGGPPDNPSQGGGGLTPPDNQHPNGGGYRSREEEKIREEKKEKCTPLTPQAGGMRARACRKNAEFAAFYAAYPLHEAPDEALKAWLQVTKAGADPAEIMAGLADYQFRSDPRYIKHPASWLRAGCWKSEPQKIDPVLRVMGYGQTESIQDMIDILQANDGNLH